MRPLHPVLPFALALLLVGAARAGTLSVPLNHSVRLPVQGAANVVVGNARIADVTVVDSHTVFVSGRGYGTSDVIITGENGRTLYSGDITVVPPASAVTVFRGVQRSEVSCEQGCEQGEAAAPASPLASLFAGMGSH